jgi:hypothetical protein
MNNFYNEPPIARQLVKFIPPTGKVPSQVNPTLFTPELA